MFSKNHWFYKENILWLEGQGEIAGDVLTMFVAAGSIKKASEAIKGTKVVGVGLTLKSTINREILGLSPEAAFTIPPASVFWYLSAALSTVPQIQPEAAQSR